MLTPQWNKWYVNYHRNTFKNTSNIPPSLPTHAKQTAIFFVLGKKKKKIILPPNVHDTKKELTNPFSFFLSFFLPFNVSFVAGTRASDRVVHSRPCYWRAVESHLH
jgi:hypothetical protein